MSEVKNKSLPFVSGLVVGAAAAAGTAFLYKTKKGKKIRKILSGYYNEAKEQIDALVKEVKKDTRKKALPQATVKAVKKRLKTVKKNLFLKSGKPLVK